MEFARIGFGVFVSVSARAGGGRRFLGKPRFNGMGFRRRIRSMFITGAGALRFVFLMYSKGRFGPIRLGGCAHL